MIQVKETNGALSILLTVSDFCDSMGYCEYKIPLSINGIVPPSTEATNEGFKAHQRQEQYEKEQYEKKPITREELADIKKDIEFPYEAISTRLILPITSKKHSRANALIYGRADKIYRNQETLIVEESKYPSDASRYLNINEPYPDQKLQTLLYLNSTYSNNNGSINKNWFTIPHTRKVWILKIKDRNTGKTIKTFQGIQTTELEAFMKNNLERFASIVSGELEPKHHRSRAKCLKCRIQSCRHNLCPK